MADITDDTKTFTIALTAPAIPAKGTIVGLTYPVSVEHGAAFDVNASTKNVGTLPGTFKMQLFIDGDLVSSSASFELAGGATSTDKIPSFNAPGSGDSMALIIKCIRIS